MPLIPVNGTRLWYEFTGQGPIVVQIGGAVSAHEGYATITPGLSEHYRVLDYDHRGYGSSDRPEQPYTLDTWSDDLAGLLDALDLERVHVHGGSMGSFIAVNFAARYPDRVDKLLLGAGAVAKCDQMGVLQFRVWQHLAKAYGVDSPQLSEELLTKAFSRNYLDSHFVGDEALKEMQEITARNASMPVFIDACQAMIDTDVRGRLADVKARTLVMVGSEDNLTPLDAGPRGAGARYVAEHLPDARLVVFDGSGHGHYIEQPEESLKAILEFLAV